MEDGFERMRDMESTLWKRLQGIGRGQKTKEMDRGNQCGHQKDRR
jgi:hypothetical protein